MKGDAIRKSALPTGAMLRHLNNWLYPGQRWHWKRLDPMRRGLWEGDAIRVDCERREWRIVGMDALPTKSTWLDGPLPMRVAMPPGSDRGALIDLAMLYHCRTVSGPVFASRVSGRVDSASMRPGQRCCAMVAAD